MRALVLKLVPLALVGLVSAASADDKVVNIYNWSDYIDPAMLEKFTADTGIKVVYDNYDNNEIVETKLFAGGSGYDVVVPSGPNVSRQIQAGTRATVLDNPKEADAILAFTQETKEKEILSLTGTGRVREFRLNYRVGFRLHDGKGNDYLPQGVITLTRDVTFNDSEVLAKEAEEALLYRDMQTDMVQQIMRRIASAQKPQKP